MIELPIAFGDGAAEEFQDREIVQGRIAKVVGLDDGMVSGKPSVGFFIEMPDGRLVFAETSYALFEAAAAAMRGRWR
jgi:hypothetical protein